MSFTQVAPYLEIDHPVDAETGVPGVGKQIIYPYIGDSLYYRMGSDGIPHLLGSGGAPATFESVSLTGTGGDGFLEALAQSAAPDAPDTAGFRLYGDADGDLSWRLNDGGTDTYTRTFAGALTANRTYLLPDYDGTFATLAGVETFTNKTLTSPALSNPSITGVMLSADGAVGAPSLSFTSDPDTGIYRSAADKVAIAAGGVKVAVGDLSAGSRRWIVGDGLATARLIFDGAAATVRDFIYQTASVSRWILRTDSTAEGGSNAGSDFVMLARDDAGAGLFDNVITAKRSTGFVGINIAPASIGAQLHIINESASTSTVDTSVIVANNTTGTAAAGFGGSLLLRLESSTTANQSAARLRWYWNTATHASRKAYGILSAYDTAERDVIGWGANGSASLVGFHNIATAPVIQYATTGTTTGFTAGAGTAVLSDSTFTGNTGSTAYTIGDVVRALKLVGLMAA